MSDSVPLETPEATAAEVAQLLVETSALLRGAQDVDKVCGWLLRERRYPAEGGVLWVSGRAGAEIVLKAARARIPVLAAVGAPSSLAVTLARAARLTLIGFLREGRMNVYCGEERIGP